MKIEAAEIRATAEKLKDVVRNTPTERIFQFSKDFDADIYFKREDLQSVRSYKLRGAYNNITSYSPEAYQKGVVCASAGNHAQGVALSCKLLDIKGHIFMPNTTPNQKVKQVKRLGESWIEVILEGDTFDDSYNKALSFCEEQQKIFIHPFNNYYTICGQGTVGLEILENIKEKIDYIFLPVGGGGLSAGVGAYFKEMSPDTKIIGVEPAGAPAMKKSIEYGEVVTLEEIDKFIDGAAVKRVGDITFDICREVIDEVCLVPEGKVCSTILKLYNEEAIVAEPAGALSIAAMDFYRDQLKGKTAVAVLSGGNNDIDRMAEIKERSLVYEGLKNYFIVTFPQRPGALAEFAQKVLGPGEDITRFEYIKKTNKEFGAALIGIELHHADDYNSLIERMKSRGFAYKIINDDPALFSYLI